jgi:hypothetical protein
VGARFSSIVNNNNIPKIAALNLYRSLFALFATVVTSKKAGHPQGEPLHVNLHYEKAILT